MAYSGLVKRIFWTKVALFSKNLSSMPNISSYFLTTLPLGVSLPTVSTPSIFTALNVALIGPSFPKSVE